MWIAFRYEHLPECWTVADRAIRPSAGAMDRPTRQRNDNAISKTDFAQHG